MHSQQNEQSFCKIIKNVFQRVKTDYLQTINNLVEVLHQQIIKIQKLFILTEQDEQIEQSRKQDHHDLNQNQNQNCQTSFKILLKSIQEQYKKLIKVDHYSKDSFKKTIQFFLQHKVHKALIRPIQKTTNLIQKQLQILISLIGPHCKKLKSFSDFGQNQKYKKTLNQLDYFSCFLVNFQSFEQQFQNFISTQNSYSFKKTTQFKSQNIQIVQKFIIQSSKNTKSFPLQQPHYIVFDQMMNIQKNQFTFKNQSDGFNLDENQGQQLVFGLIDPITFKKYQNPFQTKFKQNKSYQETKNIDCFLFKMICYNKDYYIKNQQLAKAILYKSNWRRFNLKIQNGIFLLSGIESCIFAYSSQENLKQNSSKIYLKTENDKDKLLNQGKKLYEQIKYHKIIEIPLPPCLKFRVLKPLIWFKGFHLRVHVFQTI